MVDQAAVVRKLERLPREPADDEAERAGEDDLVDPGRDDPVLQRLVDRVTVVGALHEVEREEEEGVAEAVVGATLGGEDVSDLDRDMLFGVATLDDCEMNCGSALFSITETACQLNALVLAKIGSVGVMQAAMARHSRKVKLGTKSMTKPAEMNQATVMIGRRRMKSESHSRLRYAAGRSIPANMTSAGFGQALHQYTKTTQQEKEAKVSRIPMTMRVIWKVRLNR